MNNRVFYLLVTNIITDHEIHSNNTNNNTMNMKPKSNEYTNNRTMTIINININLNNNGMMIIINNNVQSLTIPIIITMIAMNKSMILGSMLIIILNDNSLYLFDIYFLSDESLNCDRCWSLLDQLSMLADLIYFHYSILCNKSTIKFISMR